MREDTYRLALNPAAATTKRREPPPAVLDFYETEEVEAIARAAEAGADREVTKLTYDDSELAARAQEDLQDAELFRVAAYTGLRLGELLALRWADVSLGDRRLVVHHAFSDRIEGPTKGWQARFLPIADPAAEAFARLAERCEFVGAGDYVFCSRSAGRWTAQRSAAASSAPRRRPASACSASTPCGTAPARWSLARPTRAGFRPSSAIRSSPRPSAICTPRLGPRTWTF